MRHIIALMLVLASFAPSAFAMSHEEYTRRQEQLSKDYATLDIKQNHFNGTEKEINENQAELVRLEAEHDVLIKEFANQVAEPMKQLTGAIDDMNAKIYRLNHPTRLDYCKAFIWNMERPFKAIIRAITP